MKAQKTSLNQASTEKYPMKENSPRNRHTTAPTSRRIGFGLFAAGLPFRLARPDFAAVPAVLPESFPFCAIVSTPA
jgi:hypothetical protein